MIWPFIILSYFALFVFGLSDNIRGPLFPEIMREFGVSDSMGSLMFALSSFSGFVASHFARFFLRKYNRKLVLQVSAFSLSVSLLGLALSQQFVLFLFFSVCFGLSLGILGLIPNVLAALGSSPEKKQKILSGLHAMYGVASFFAPLFAAAIGTWMGSWRWTFGAASLIPLTLIAYTMHSSHSTLHQKNVLTKDEHRAMRKKNLRPQLFLAFMVSFCVAAEIMVSSRLALYMRRVWNYDLEQSSLYVTYFFVFLLSGRFLFALISFPRSIRFQLSIGLALAAALFYMGVYVHPFFLAMTGLPIAPFYPLSIAWISSEFPDDLDTAVSYMMATDSMMLIFMHLLFGRMTDLFDIKVAILAGPVFLLLSFILVNGYDATFKKAPRS